MHECDHCGGDTRSYYGMSFNVRGYDGYRTCKGCQDEVMDILLPTSRQVGEFLVEFPAENSSPLRCVFLNSSKDLRKFLRKHRGVQNLRLGFQVEFGDETVHWFEGPDAYKELQAARADPKKVHFEYEESDIMWVLPAKAFGQSRIDEWRKEIAELEEKIRHYQKLAKQRGSVLVDSDHEYFDDDDDEDEGKDKEDDDEPKPKHPRLDSKQDDEQPAKPKISQAKSCEFVRAAEEGNLARVMAYSADPQVDINRLGSSSQTALHVACIQNHVDMVRHLLQDPRQNCDLPLISACELGHEGVVKLLLNHQGVDVNAVRETETPIWYALKRGAVRVAKTLLASGRLIDTTWRDSNNWDLGIWATIYKDSYQASGSESKEDEVNKRLNFVEIGAAIKLFEADPPAARFQFWKEIGESASNAGFLFALVVSLCDGYFRVSPTRGNRPPDGATRFMKMAASLPMDLQMLLCNKTFGLETPVITKNHSEPGFQRVFNMKNMEAIPEEICDNFKHEILVDHITSSIMELRRPRADPINIYSGLKKIFGDKAYALFKRMTLSQREESMDYYRISGGEAVDMMGAGDSVDNGWSRGAFSIDCVKFKANSEVIYSEVVRIVVPMASKKFERRFHRETNRCYSVPSPNQQEELIAKFLPLSRTI